MGVLAVSDAALPPIIAGLVSTYDEWVRFAVPSQVDATDEETPHEPQGEALADNTCWELLSRRHDWDGDTADGALSALNGPVLFSFSWFHWSGRRRRCCRKVESIRFTFSGHTCCVLRLYTVVVVPNPFIHHFLLRHCHHHPHAIVIATTIIVVAAAFAFFGVVVILPLCYRHCHRCCSFAVVSAVSSFVVVVVRSFVRSFVCSFVCSSSFVLRLRSFVRRCLFVRRSFVVVVVVRSFVRSSSPFVRSFVRSFVRRRRRRRRRRRCGHRIARKATRSSSQQHNNRGCAAKPPHTSHFTIVSPLHSVSNFHSISMLLIRRTIS